MATSRRWLSLHLVLMMSDNKRMLPYRSQYPVVTVLRQLRLGRNTPAR